MSDVTGSHLSSAAVAAIIGPMSPQDIARSSEEAAGMNASDKFDQDEGLHEVKVRASNDAAWLNVVFVHGLGGSGRKTWDAGESSEIGFWPETLAREHPSCRVWTLNYESSVYNWNPLARGRLDLLDRAVWFLDTLRTTGIQTLPIVFVCHSLGGLLVKQALQYSDSIGPKEWKAVWNRMST